MVNKIEFFNKAENKIVGSIEFKNFLGNEPVEMNINGEIVSDELNKFSTTDVCPQDVIDALEQVGNKDLVININSCGGSVFAGIGIYNTIKQKCKGNISVNITGIGASIASVIAMCGNTINMGVGSQLMIHKPLCGCTGNAKDFAQAIAMLDKVEESIVDVYMANAKNGITRTYIQNLMDKETHLTVDDCKKLFKNIKSVDDCKKQSNSITNQISTDVIDIEKDVCNEVEIQNSKEIEVKDVDLDTTAIDKALKDLELYIEINR
ncbi:head maturation protease, ClpP-related [Clostridium sp.]|uniref:head maturation protease, ClpP-related n=1 Tax=Clostridium sp. TaxID=1506 RepID=UPI0039944804